MEKSEQVIELIREAYNRGWTGNEFANQSESGQITLHMQTKGRGYSTIEYLLFGDNLSFLKALFGKNRTTLPLHNPDWLNVAIGLVQNPDDVRIPSLYTQVFGDQDD